MPFPDVSLVRRQRFLGTLALVGIVVLLIGLAGQLVYLQQSLGAKLTDQASRARSSRLTLPAQRGRIVDARGRVIATTRLVPNVFVDPKFVKDVDHFSARLAARLNVPADELAQKIARRADKRYVRVASKVDSVTAAAVREMKDGAVGLDRSAVRSYPLGESMAHVLGFVGRDGFGMEGLERQFDDHLRGVDGRHATIRDARRRALWRASGGLIEPVDGGHLTLTIDAEIQRIAEESLAHAIDDFEAQSGVAIVMSPRTGDILAMVSWPPFDPANAGASSPDVRRNRAVTDPVEPGSTIKPFIISGALDGGFVNRTEEIDCHGGRKRFGNRIVQDVSANGIHNVKGILCKSSNVGMAIIADRMGNAALHQTFQSYGFGSLSGITCPAESAGILHPLSAWKRADRTSVSFGYFIAVTPLQLVTAFSAILNDGILLKPRIVRDMRNADGSVIRSFNGPDVVGRAMSQATAAYLAKDVLPAVVTDGGGRRAKLDQYRVAGKTGTAELLNEKRVYDGIGHLTLFLGAAPLNNSQIAALVIVRRPNKELGYLGGKVAAPAVARILDETLAYLGVPPDKTTNLAGR